MISFEKMSAYEQSQKMYVQILKRGGAHFQNATMVHSILNNQLLEEKRSKPCTPLSFPTPSTWKDIQGLLLERCILLKNACDSILEDPFQLYLFGSQVNGVSQSGNPDLDIWCIYPKGSFEQKKSIVQACPFKLDFAFIERIHDHARCIRLFD